ncbi:MAG: TRAP transporter small permease [Hyphomicrobiales bacterium]|nr:TRAP transporter small permease [Hyphomicrobiales bacterium]
MSAAVIVPADGSFLSRLDRALFRFETSLALLGGLAVAALMLLAVVSVGGRSILNQPLPGYVDWIEQAMPLIAFLGLAYCQRLGGHIRMDVVVRLLRGRALWAAEFVSVCLMLVLMVVLVWGSWSHFDRSFDWAAPLWSRDSSLDIRLPLWPAKLLAPIGFTVLGLRLVLQLWAYGRAFVTGTSAPVAVPPAEDSAAAAAHEAEAVVANGNEDRR